MTFSLVSSFANLMPSAVVNTISGVLVAADSTIKGAQASDQDERTSDLLGLRRKLTFDSDQMIDIGHMPEPEPELEPHTSIETDKFYEITAPPPEAKLSSLACSYVDGFTAGVSLARKITRLSKDVNTPQIRLPADIPPCASRDEVHMLGFAAGREAVMSVSVKRADLALNEIASLQEKIQQAHDKLRLGLRSVGVTGLESAETAAGHVSNTTLSVWERLGLTKHWLKGAFSATVNSLGFSTIALALPSVTGGSLFAKTAAAYLVGRVVSDFSDSVKDGAGKSLITDVQEALKSLFSEHSHLITQEKLRQSMVERINLVCLEREALVSAIQLEMSRIDKVIKALQPSTNLPLDEFLSAKPAEDTPLPLQTPDDPPTAHAPSPDKLESLRATFRVVLNILSEQLTRLSRFFSDLPHYFLPTNTFQNEATFLEEYKEPLSVLAKLPPSNSSLYNKDDHVWSMSKEGIKKKDMGQASEEPRRLFYIGENLVKIIKEADTPTIGAVLVPPPQSSGSWVVPAHLSLARAMGTYFSMLASQSDDAPALGGVIRNQDGSISVDDPRGDLYGFLMSMPSAYTDSMAGLPYGQATCRLTLDDPTSGFPGGACSMQFEQALKLGADGKPMVDGNGSFVTELQVRFLSKQPNPVYNPLGNERTVLRDMDMISIATEQEAAESEQADAAPDVGSVQTLDRLLERQEELAARLEQETALLEASLCQLGGIEYHWNLPKPNVTRPTSSTA